MGKWSGTKRMGSFGDLSLVTWLRISRKYIAVSKERENPETYVAKLYDGAEYTGIYVRMYDLEELYRDIERYTLGLAKEKPGPADPEDLICVYM